MMAANVTAAVVQKYCMCNRKMIRNTTNCCNSLPVSDQINKQIISPKEITLFSAMKGKYTGVKINNTTFDTLLQNETQKKQTKHHLVGFACVLMPSSGDWKNI